MKKTFLTLLLCAAATATYAQKISVVSGKIDFLKEESLIGLVFTYENMRVGKMTEEGYVTKKVQEFNAKEPGRGDAWHMSWISDREERFEPMFIELFNKYMTEKRDLTIGKESGTRYTFHVNTTFTEPGYNVYVHRRNASISLTITAVDNETGAKAAVIMIPGASANDFFGTDYDTGYRIQECYAKAGRELAKYFIKQLKF